MDWCHHCLEKEHFTDNWLEYSDNHNWTSSFPPANNTEPYIRMPTQNGHTAPPARNLGVEILRLVAMLFIVMHHIFYHGQLYHKSSYPAHAKIAFWSNKFVYSGVDIFGLISGFVGYTDYPKPQKRRNYWTWINIKIYQNHSPIYKTHAKICLSARRKFVYVSGEKIFDNPAPIYGNRQKIFGRLTMIAESRNVFRSKFIDIRGNGSGGGFVLNGIILDIAGV